MFHIFLSTRRCSFLGVSDLPIILCCDLDNFTLFNKCLFGRVQNQQNMRPSHVATSLLIRLLQPAATRSSCFLNQQGWSCSHSCDGELRAWCTVCPKLGQHYNLLDACVVQIEKKEKKIRPNAPCKINILLAWLPTGWIIHKGFYTLMLQDITTLKCLWFIPR